MIGPGETCKAVNREDYPVTIGWGNIQYILQPQRETFVPAEAIMNFFGDPRAINNMQRVEQANGQSAWIPDRQTEVRRLRIKWQNLNMGNGEDELYTPNVDVYTLDGEAVPTVAKDPEGLAVNPAGRSKAEELDRDTIIARMQEQLDQLIKERNVQELHEPATVEGEIPVDDPSVVTETKRQPRARAANEG